VVACRADYIFSFRSLTAYFLHLLTIFCDHYRHMIYFLHLDTPSSFLRIVFSFPIGAQATSFSRCAPLFSPFLFSSGSQVFFLLANIFFDALHFSSGSDIVDAASPRLALARVIFIEMPPAFIFLPCRDAISVIRFFDAAVSHADTVARPPMIFIFFSFRYFNPVVFFLLPHTIC